MSDGRIRITDYPFLIGLMEFNPKGLEFYQSSSKTWLAYVYCNSLEQKDQIKAYALINNKETLSMPILKGMHVGKFTLKIEIS